MKLFVDSSTNYLYIGLLKDNKLYTKYRLGKNDHSEMMVSTIEEFLNELSLNINDVKEVYVGRGPGSYTGLRINGTFGKTLSLIKDIPLYSFSSLDMLLVNNLENDGKYLAKIKAKKDYSYVKAITVKAGKIEVMTNDSFVNDSELVKYLDFTVIEASEDEIKFDNIIKYHLYQEENNIEYTPNYLRSEFN